MGRRLLKLLGSDPGFLRMGLTAADLKGVGTIPVDSEEWMMAEMRGSKEERQDLTKEVGRGSSWHVEDLDLVISSDITEGLGSSKEEKG